MILSIIKATYELIICSVVSKKLNSNLNSIAKNDIENQFSKLSSYENNSIYNKCKCSKCNNNISEGIELFMYNDNEFCSSYCRNKYIEINSNNELNSLPFVNKEIGMII